MSEQSQLVAQYIAKRPEFSPYVPREGYPYGIWAPDHSPTLTADEIADAMLEDVGFQALKLGGFLRTPDGELIAEGVGLALSPADRPVFKLAVDALTFAAERQQTIGPKQAGVGVLAAALLLWLIGRDG
jgi:hypothetical protein